MLHRVRRHHNIADIDLISQRARNSCIDDRADLETVRQNLAAHPGIDLSNTGAHHNRVPAL